MTSKFRLGPLEFLVLLIGIPMAVWAVMWSYQGVQAHTAPDSILGVSRISAVKIDKVLCDNHSPACHSGTSLYNEGWNYDIDANFALAVFKSGNDFGKFTCTQTLACIAYDKKSWASTYATWYAAIHKQYVANGDTTISQVVDAMAPPNTTAYMADVNASMSTWRAAS